MLPRLYLPTAAADSAHSLTSAQSRHLIKVLRQKRGAALIVFDGAGNAYAAHIENDDKSAAVIQTAAALPPAPADAGAALHIGQTLCAPAKMDWTIEKMTELGATEITPLITARSPARATDQQQQRWQRLIIAACAQCGRNRLPQLHPPQPLDDWRPDATRILLSPRAAQPLTALIAKQHGAIAIAIGGESGFSEEEEKQLTDSSFHPAHIGARILRTETAALTAMAIITAQAPPG